MIDLVIRVAGYPVCPFARWPVLDIRYLVLGTGY